MDTAYASAIIVPFVPRTVPESRLTVADRIDAHEWNRTIAASAGARLSIHDRRTDDPPEVGDFIGIYRAGEALAQWGAARRGGLVTIWHGPSGTDLGRFRSLRDALGAVPRAALHPRPKRR